MAAPYHRDVGPILQIIRSFLRGRSWNEQLRLQEHLSPRPYPQPELPGGPSDKISLNYYYTRDARRLVEPPLQLIDSTKQLSSGEAEQTQQKTIGSKSAPKPGNTYNWDKL